MLDKTRRIGTWWVDWETSQVHWSKTTYEIHEEDVAKQITLQEGIQYYIPEHQTLIQGCIQEAIQQRRPWDVELQIRTTSGCVRWVRAIGEPKFEGDHLLRLQGIFEDIDERKQLEVEREELNRRLTLALDASKIGVWDWTVATGELIWDEGMYALYGIDRFRFSGAYDAWEAGLHPDDKAEAVADLKGAVADRKKFEATFRVLWPDGTERTLRGIGDVVLDANGDVQRMIGVNWDITHVVRVQGELERSNQELAQFAYRTSHDLKSPLTIIRRLADYVLSDLRDGNDGEVQKNVKRISQRAEEMETMVLGILDAAKADLNDSPAEPLDLNALLQQVVDAHDELASQHGVTIRCSVDCSIRPALQAARLRQILDNLVGNAIKYHNPRRSEKSVEIAVTCEEKILRICVKDNGAGIPVSNPDEPFRMFRRFHADVSGSGLGLYIVKKHVQALGGEIQLQSSEEGSQFHIALPIREPLEADCDQDAPIP